MLFWQVTGFVLRRKKILVLVCEDFGLIGINYGSIQEIKFNYGKLGCHVAEKKNSRPMQPKKKNSNLKNPKVGILKKKKELKTANKTSNGIGRFIHDTSCECMIRHVSAKRKVTC